MPLIAGAVDLDVVMQRLRGVRPVFHSEADFQHWFGQVLHNLDPDLNVRLEVRQDDAEYLDLLCFGPAGRTAVEFKYKTASWDGTDTVTGEMFRLRTHAAEDLARRDFVFDIARLERFCRAAAGETGGLAVMLTNVAGLWAPPASARQTRDGEFRIHEGRTLTGVLRWGGGYPANERQLAGCYQLGWRDYSELSGRNGMFRWLAVTVEAAR